MTPSLIVVLLASLSSPAQALRAVSPSVNVDDYLAIQAQIERGRTQELIADALQDEIDSEQGKIAPDRGRIEALQNNMRFAREDRSKALNRALKMTMDAYQIPVPRGQSVRPENRGESIAFLPVFDPILMDDYTLATRQGPLRAPPTTTSKRPDARTFINGVSVFRTIPADPRALALLLVHESKHAEQFAGTAPPDYEEYRARKAALDAFFAVGYTGDDEPLRLRYEEYARMAKSAADYAKTFRGKSTLFFDGVARGLGLAAEKRDEFTLPKDKLDRLRSEAARLRDSIEHERATRLEAAPQNAASDKSAYVFPAAPAAAPSAHSPIPEAAPDGRAPMALLRMVDAACARDWASPDVAASLRLTSWDLDYLATKAQTLSLGCARSLLERLIPILRSGQSLSLERLQAETAAANPPSAHEEYVPSEPRGSSGNCVNRGVWHNDCY